MSIVDDLADELDDPLVRLDPPEVYDAAVVGYAHYKSTPVLVYDADLVIAQKMKHDGDSYEDALEWHEFNTFSAWMGEGAPIFLWRMRHDS
jgi:hypothetical protein